MRPMSGRKPRPRPSAAGKGPRLGRRALLLAGLSAATLGPAAVWAARPGSDLIGRLRFHLTRREDVLLDVARRWDLGMLELSAANPGIDPWIPPPDRLVLLPTAHLLPDAPRRGIVINLAELRLYYFRPDGVIETHAIGIGRQGRETPLGTTRIVRKAKNPTWYPPASIRREDPSLPRVVPPGPDNPLGTRALYLGWPSYLIHGTIKPYGVGRRVSAGCIRMYPEQIESMYERVPIGTPVRVLEQTIKVGWHEGELWLEAHPDYDQLEELEIRYTMTPKPPPAGAFDHIRRKAGERAHEIDWDRVEAELVARRGYPVRITGSRPRTVNTAAVSLGDLY